MSKLWQTVKHREAWDTVVHWVVKSWTQLNNNIYDFVATEIQYCFKYLILLHHYNVKPCVSVTFTRNMLYLVLSSNQQDRSYFLIHLCIFISSRLPIRGKVGLA